MWSDKFSPSSLKNKVLSSFSPHYHHPFPILLQQSVPVVLPVEGKNVSGYKAFILASSWGFLRCQPYRNTDVPKVT